MRPWGLSAWHRRPSRLLKAVHLRRWFASVLAATYLQYVSLDLRQTALHLDRFEQPGEKRFFRILTGDAVWASPVVSELR
jgi:hypothetical protein